MKLYCSSCNIFVAEIKEGSHIRKGTVLVCSKCIARLKIADNMAKMAKDQSKSADYPEFFKNLFDKFDKK